MHVEENLRNSGDNSDNSEIFVEAEFKPSEASQEERLEINQD